VVGNVDRNRLLDRINATFGSIPRAPRPDLSVVTPAMPSHGPASVSSTLSSFLGNSGSFSAAFRTEGRDHPDAAALIVLSNHLNTLFYEHIRVKAGLSYAPETVMFFQPDYGIFYSTADSSVRNIEQLQELMIGILEKLLREKIAPEEVERTKRKILLQWAQGYETNAGLASFYVERLSHGAHEGRRRTGNGSDLSQNYEKEIERVSADDLDRVIMQYLRSERRIDIRSVPTMSYSAFFTYIGGVLLVIAIVTGYRVRKAKRLKKGMLPVYIKK